MGLAGYMDELRLSEADAYDVQGNHFDFEAIILRIGSSLCNWIQGAQLPLHTFPPPDLIVPAFEDLRRWVSAQGHVTMPHPLPPDVRSEMQRFGQLLLEPPRGRSGGGPLGTTLSAAEHGRVGQ